MAKKYHPDTNQDDPQAKEKFAKLAEAYEVDRQTHTHTHTHTHNHQHTHTSETGTNQEIEH